MGTDSVIYIRTDGNSQIATGHLVRCLSIARALCREAADKCSLSICFLLSDEESKRLLERFFEMENEFKWHILPGADYQHPELELNELLALGNSSRPILLIDSYFVTEKYLTALHNVFTLVYLDDLRAFDYPVDMVINYDLLTPAMRKDYEQFYHSAHKKLLGGGYAPLRPQFWENPSLPTEGTVSNVKAHHIEDSGQKEGSVHILIASGGSDPYHTTLQLVRELSKQFPAGYCFDLIVGAYNPDKEELQKLAKNSPIVLHERVTQMAALMASCDLAISAAGTTLYELCAVGIPTASFVLADNQLASAKAFEECHIIPYLGDVRANENDVIKKATTWVASNSHSAPSKNKNQGNREVDGKGALRIAKELLFYNHNV